MTRHTRGMAPFAYLPGRPLSVAELTAAALDGDLRRVSRTAFAPPASPDTALLRASAAAELVPDGCAAVRTSAAWIHGALADEPDPHHVQQREGEPTRRHWRTGLIAHTWPLASGDLEEIAGVAVTTLERTFYDVGRAIALDEATPDDARAAAWFCARTELHERLRTWLGRPRRLRYTTRVAALLDQDEVTRYTS